MEDCFSSEKAEVIGHTSKNWPRISLGFGTQKVLKNRWICNMERNKQTCKCTQTVNAKHVLDMKLLISDLLQKQTTSYGSNEEQIWNTYLLKTSLPWLYPFYGSWIFVTSIFCVLFCDSFANYLMWFNDMRNWWTGLWLPRITYS